MNKTDKPLSTAKSLDSVYAFQRATKAKQSAVTDPRTVARVKDENERCTLRNQRMEQLREAVLELRKAWIAPHRFSEQKASLEVARISDEIQQLEY